MVPENVRPNAECSFSGGQSAGKDDGNRRCEQRDAGTQTSGQERPAGKRFGLNKSQRLRSPRDFEAVYAERNRRGDRHLLLFARKNELPQTRFGVSVSRKHGNAVKRNRIKRLLREAFRLSQHDLPAGWDFILIPRQNSGATLDDYRRSLVQLAGRLTETIEQQNEKQKPPQPEKPV